MPVESASQMLRLNIRTGEWEPFTQLPSPRMYHSLAVIDNQIYIIGKRHAITPRWPSELCASPIQAV